MHNIQIPQRLQMVTTCRVQSPFASGTATFSMVQPRRFARHLSQEVESSPHDGVTRVTQTVPLGMTFCTRHPQCTIAFANDRGLNVALEDEALLLSFEKRLPGGVRLIAEMHDGQRRR